MTSREILILSLSKDNAFVRTLSPGSQMARP